MKKLIFLLVCLLFSITLLSQVPMRTLNYGLNIPTIVTDTIHVDSIKIGSAWINSGTIPVNGILKWSSSAYNPYPSSGTAATAGKFYLGETTVNAADLQLNYTGGLWINSDEGRAVSGMSVSNFGVVGLSISNSGGYFGSTSGKGLHAVSQVGPGAWIGKSSTLTTHDANEVLQLYRVNPAGTYNLTGDIILIEDNPTTSGGTISGSVLKAKIDNTIRINFNPRVVDGASAIAYMFDTRNALATSGAKLISVKNQGVEKFSIDKNGTITADTIKNTVVRVAPFEMNFEIAHSLMVFKDSSITITGAAGGNQLTNAYDSLWQVKEMQSLTYIKGDTIQIDYEGGYNISFSVQGSGNLNADWELNLLYKRGASTNALDNIYLFSTGGANNFEGCSGVFYQHFLTGDKLWFILKRIAGAGDFVFKTSNWNIQQLYSNDF